MSGRHRRPVHEADRLPSAEAVAHANGNTATPPLVTGRHEATGGFRTISDSPQIMQLSNEIRGRN